MILRTNSFSNVQMWSDFINMSSSWSVSEGWFMPRNRSWTMSDSKSLSSYLSRSNGLLRSTNWRKDI